MNNENFLRVYNRINIALGVMLILFVVVFIAQFPAFNNGLIEKNIFMISIKTSQGSINILNAPSPAATSSLSIGNTVSEMVLKRFTS